MDTLYHRRALIIPIACQGSCKVTSGEGSGAAGYPHPEGAWCRPRISFLLVLAVTPPKPTEKWGLGLRPKDFALALDSVKKGGRREIGLRKVAQQSVVHAGYQNLCNLCSVWMILLLSIAHELLKPVDQPFQHPKRALDRFGNGHVDSG